MDREFLRSMYRPILEGLDMKNLIAVALVLLACSTAQAVCPAPSGSGCADDELQGIFSPRCYGGIADDTLMDTEAIQCALDASAHVGEVVVPGGVWLVDDVIDVTARRIVGVHYHQDVNTISGSVIQVDPDLVVPLAAVLRSTSGTTQIEGLLVDAGRLAEIGVLIDGSGHVTAHVENVAVWRALDAGVMLDAAQIASMERVVAHSSGCGEDPCTYDGHGIRIRSCNAATLTHLLARGCEGDGIVLEGGAEGSGGLTLISPRVEDCDGYGVRVEDVLSPMLISGGWIESNTLDGVRLVDSRFITVADTYISGDGDGSNRGIVLDGTDLSSIHGVAVACSDGTCSGTTRYNSASVVGEENTLSGNWLHSVIETNRYPLPVYYTGRNTVSGPVEAPGTAAPTTGYWLAGDRVWQSSPAASAPMGWICTVTGTPGTWRAMPDL